MRSATKPPRTLGDGFQYRLNIRRGGSDHTEDLACHGLLLQRFAQLVEQPRVLDGDDGLGGEIGQQRDLLVAEGTNLLVVYDDRTDQLIFFLEHGNGEDAAVAGELHVGNHPRVTLDIGALLHEVGDIGHLAFGGDQTQPAVRMRPEHCSTQAAGASCSAVRRKVSPLPRYIAANFARQIRTAFSSKARYTGPRSPGELEMTRSTSAVAVCCCSDSRSSLSSRAFSMAITAWSAKVVSRAICLCSKGRISVRRMTMVPTALPSRISGTARILR